VSCVGREPRGVTSRDSRHPAIPARLVAAAVLAFGAASLTTSTASPAAAQEVVYVVRHAEQVADVDDPPLSEQGKARARMLREFFRDAGLTAVYGTDLRRTMETGAIVTEPLGFEVTPVQPDSLDGLVGRVRREQPGGRVLIVGHSNTVPRVLEQLGYPNEITIDHDEYDNLFIVVPTAEGPPLVLWQRMVLPAR
jgi:phosphohistidine phosphatase SixA